MNNSLLITGGDLYSFNEAYSNQMRYLSELYNIPVFTLGDTNGDRQISDGNYTVFTNRWIGDPPVLDIVNKVGFLIELKRRERKFDRIILAGGVESYFLRVLNLSKTVPIISSIDREQEAKTFAKKYASKIPRIVVQSRGALETLVEYGVNEEKITFTYPIVDSQFKPTPPPADGPFRFLFASAPNVRKANEDNYLSKGVSLLLRSFQKASSDTYTELVLLWRDCYLNRVRQEIEKLGVGNVKIVNESVDPIDYYKSSHATVIPYTSALRSPQYPLSALESLASGRPVVSTRVVELSNVIRDEAVGVASKTTVEDMADALEMCYSEYGSLQQNAKKFDAPEPKRLLNAVQSDI